MKTNLFQSCHGQEGFAQKVFQVCWCIEWSTFRASSFRIWNSSTGIPSPPLALFVVMLPKVHLTLYSRMSHSRWVIMTQWLSGSWRHFLYFYSVYYCHLFLISSASIRSIPFLFLIYIQDGRVERHVLIICWENSKITTCCWATINCRMVIPLIKDTPCPNAKEKTQQDGRRG